MISIVNCPGEYECGEHLISEEAEHCFHDSAPFLARPDIIVLETRIDLCTHTVANRPPSLVTQIVTKSVTLLVIKS
jgi:hypothetical protein